MKQVQTTRKEANERVEEAKREANEKLEEVKKQMEEMNRRWEREVHDDAYNSRSTIFNK